MSPKISAGLLPYRIVDGSLEVLLAHYGGPLWARKDLGAWTVVKGEVEGSEDLLQTAKREFNEETGIDVSEVADFISLGEIRQRGGKIVHARAFLSSEALAKEDRSIPITPNTFEMEWPPHSGQKQQFPEIDRAEWFSLEIARQKINPAQIPFLERLKDFITKCSSQNT